MENEKRTKRILELILPSIHLHKQTNWRPFVLGVTGLQGSGKSFLAASLVQVLNHEHSINAIEVSLDDFYLPHTEQVALRKQHPSFDLLKNRGQPSTHDTALAKSFFYQFLDEKPTEDLWVPSFDKSCFDGDGDRVPRSEWRTLSKDESVDVLIFEGWCVGFRPLPEDDVLKKWQKATITQDARSADLRSPSGVEAQFSTTTLAKHSKEELLFINSALADYVHSFMGPQHFDFMVHLDTQDLKNVYTWRMEQEHALRKAKGSGMSDQQVVNFVQRYMPGYELYLDHLRAGFFLGNDAPQKARAHLRVLLKVDRQIADLAIIPY